MEVPLSEAFDRLEPPNGIDEVAWEGFKGHAIYVAEGIEKEKRVGLEEPPSSPDMLMKVEQSLTMPDQDDKTSSMEGHRQKAIERLKTD